MAFSKQLHSCTERTAYRQTPLLYKQWIPQPFASRVAVNIKTSAILLLVVSEYTNIFELKHNRMTTPKFIRTTIRLFAQARTDRPRATHYAYCVREHATMVACDITARVLATCLATADI
jgi:hypothetical protein